MRHKDLAATPGSGLTWAQRLTALRRISRLPPRIGEHKATSTVQSFHQAFDGITVGAAAITMQGRILDANTSLTTMLGYTADELRGMSVTDLTHPDDYQAARKLFWELLSGQRDHYRIQKRLLRKDGTVGQGLLIVALVRDTRGHPLHILGLLDELT